MEDMSTGMQIHVSSMEDMNQRLFEDVVEGRRYLRSRTHCLEIRDRGTKEAVLNHCPQQRRGLEHQGTRNSSCLAEWRRHHADGIIPNTALARTRFNSVNDEGCTPSECNQRPLECWRHAAQESLPAAPTEETAEGVAELIRSVLGRDPCAPDSLVPHKEIAPPKDLCRPRRSSPETRVSLDQSRGGSRSDIGNRAPAAGLVVHHVPVYPTLYHPLQQAPFVHHFTTPGATIHGLTGW